MLSNASHPGGEFGDKRHSRRPVRNSNNKEVFACPSKAWASATSADERVPAEYYFPNGQVWFRKLCPQCGTNESMVSSDAAAWHAKRELWEGVAGPAATCTLQCDRCSHDNHHPAILFMDVTNHCNMDCPICGFSLRGMGFDFNPPHEVF